MKTIKNLIITVLVLWLSAGCSDEIIPSLEGDMIGYVFTFDEFGNLLDNHDGVNVTAYGTRLIYSATTDKTGYFRLRGLATGTYEIHFEKAGYGTLKQFSVQHLGGQPTILALNDDRVFFLYEMPTTEITNLVLNKDTAYAEFRFKKGPEPEYISLELHFSDDPDFSEASLQYVWNFKFGVNGPNRNLWSTSYMPFTPGTTVYCKAAMNTKVDVLYRDEHNLILFSNYYYRLAGISTYFDLNTKKTVNPNLGDETKVYSFIFPE